MGPICPKKHFFSSIWGPYGSHMDPIWAQLVPYGPAWIHMVNRWWVSTWWAHMAPYGRLTDGGLVQSPFGPKWTHMGPIWSHMGPIWAHMGPIWAHMGLYGPVWAHMGPARAPPPRRGPGRALRRNPPGKIFVFYMSTPTHTFPSKKKTWLKLSRLL